MGAPSSDWTELFKRTTWPVQSAEQRAFEFDENLLIASAQALALLSYPTADEQIAGGPAQRFCEALLARMCRLAKAHGELKALPRLALDLKPVAMRSRINRGRTRLSNAFAALQTVLEAQTLESDRQAARKGERQTFSLKWSADFSRMTFTMPICELPGGLELPGAVPQTSASSLRAAVISHREAFGKGSGDAQEEYVNIYNRHIRPMFPLFSLLMVVWQALLSKAAEASERKLEALDILLRQPNWAEGLDTKIQDRQGQMIWMLRYIDIPICSCRMLEVTQRKKSNF